MPTSKPPRARPPRRRRTAPPPPPSGIPPFSAVMAGAYGEASHAIASVQNALNTATGTMLVNLLLVEGKTLEEAAASMGVSPAKLRVDGIDFTMRMSAVIAPDLCALTAGLAADIEAEVAKAKGLETHAHATAHAPGTMV